MLVPPRWCRVGAQEGAALAREAAGPSQAPVGGTEVELGGAVREESGPGPGLSGEGSGCDVTKAKRLGRDLAGGGGSCPSPTLGRQPLFQLLRPRGAPGSRAALLGVGVVWPGVQGGGGRPPVFI